MNPETTSANDLCLGCVYYPPNLPVDAYAPEDFRMLQAKWCSFDLRPGEPDCLNTRKTSCSLVELQA